MKRPRIEGAASFLISRQLAIQRSVWIPAFLRQYAYRARWQVAFGWEAGRSAGPRTERSGARSRPECLRHVGVRSLGLESGAVGLRDETVTHEVRDVSCDLAHVLAVVLIQIEELRLVNGTSCPAMKQNEAPVEVPYHVLVGTSRNGERRPPVTLPKASSTGWPFCTTIRSPCGGAIPESTHSSRFRRNASKKMWLGNRLRGPSLHDIGGGVRPALMMSDGAAA